MLLIRIIIWIPLLKVKCTDEIIHIMLILCVIRIQKPITLINILILIPIIQMRIWIPRFIILRVPMLISIHNILLVPVFAILRFSQRHTDPISSILSHGQPPVPATLTSRTLGSGPQTHVIDDPPSAKAYGAASKCRVRPRSPRRGSSDQ